MLLFGLRDLLGIIVPKSTIRGVTNSNSLQLNSSHKASLRALGKTSCGFKPISMGSPLLSPRIYGYQVFFFFWVTQVFTLALCFMFMFSLCIIDIQVEFIHLSSLLIKLEKEMICRFNFSLFYKLILYYHLFMHYHQLVEKCVDLNFDQDLI